MSSHSIARITFAVAISLGATFAASMAPARAQSAYSTEMSAGREAFDGSNFQLAERHFQGAFEVAGSDGQKATAMYSLAVIAQKQGRIEDAKQRAQKALDLSPKNSQAKRLLEDLSNVAAAPPPKTTRQAQVKAPTVADTSPAEKPVRKAPAREVAKEAAKEAAAPPAPKETASIPAPPKARELPVAKGLPLAVAADEARPKAPHATAFDASRIGTPEANGVRVIASIPAQPQPVLAAGFSEQDRKVTLLTGPTEPAAEKTQTIDLKSFDLASGSAGDVFTLHSETNGGRVALPPSGNLLATAVPAPAADGKKSRSAQATTTSIHIWDIATVDNKHAIEMTGSDRANSPIGVDLVEFSRNGRRLVVAHKAGVEVLDTSGLRGVGAYRFTSRQKEGADDAPLAMAVSGTGSRIVLTMGSRLRVVEGTSVKDVSPSGSGTIEHVALTDNGRLAAISSGSVVRLIEPLSGRVVKELGSAPAGVTALTFSPSGDRLAVASIAAVQIWPINDAKGAVAMVPAGAVERLSFSNDGRMLLAAGQKGSRVWFVDPAVTAAPEEPVAKASPVKEIPQTATAATSAMATDARDQAAATTPEPASRAEDPKAAARASQELIRARAQALARTECEVVKALDAQIGDQGVHGACAEKVEQAHRAAAEARREAERVKHVAERKQALEALDCDRVKQLDADIGGAMLAETCTKRQEAHQREAEHTKLAADHKAARADLKCDEAKALAARLGIDDTRDQVACRFQLVLKTGSARDLYLTAAKHDADRDRGAAKQLYRAIVERFPQDDLAIKAAERMTVITDLEAAESTGSIRSGTRQPRR